MDEADRAYLRRVRAEIDEEVRRRRASGDLPPQLETELEELFLKHAPLGSTRQELHEVLRRVDAAAFIDPVVPVESNRAGGALVKKGVRTLNFWYLRFITHQVSRFATAVSRSLHILDQQLSELAAKVEVLEVPPSVVVEATGLSQPDAWWVGVLQRRLEGTRRRVLHAACADGWLVAALVSSGLDAYGVDPRPDRVAEHELGDLDLRDEPVLDHLRAVQPGALGAVVFSGLMEGTTTGERRRLLDAAVTALAPDGLLVVHSLAPAAWGDEAPPEADIAGTRPYRQGTWPTLLEGLGLEETTTTAGPDGRDYLVAGRRVPDPVGMR